MAVVRNNIDIKSGNKMNWLNIFLHTSSHVSSSVCFPYIALSVLAEKGSRIMPAWGA